MYCSCKSRASAKYLINGYPLCGRCCPKNSRTDTNLIPRNADRTELNKISDEIYTARFQNLADELMLRLYPDYDVVSIHTRTTSDERKLLRFFYPRTTCGRMIKRIDPKKALKYDKIFSHVVITLILDFSTEPILLSGLSTKWRECFESPVLDLCQREDYNKWRYYSRCLKNDRLEAMMKSLCYLKYVPLALEYSLDNPKNDKLLLDKIFFWGCTDSSPMVTDFIFKYRPDLAKKTYEYLCKIKSSYIGVVKGDDGPASEIYDRLLKYIKVFEQ